MHYLASIFVTLALGIGSFFGLHSQPAPLSGAALPSATAVFETSLASPITSSATSLTLTANAIRGGGALSGFNCLTIDEGSAQAETVCGTVSGTSVTSLSRGISQSTGTTTVAALQFSHRRGANVKITDFPVIQIIKAQNNGEDTFPNLLTYTSGTACSVSSTNGTICDKAYIDGVAVAGASNANETTKGISELATQIEMASSTTLGSTLAALVLQAKYATSSPYTTGLYIPVTQNDGKLNPNFIATSSLYSYVWGGLHTFSATTTMATSTIASTTIGTLNVTNPFAISSITGTSTISSNLRVAGNSTTTNLVVSGTCTHCTVPTIVSSSNASCSGSSGATCSQSVSCSGSLILVGGGAQTSAGEKITSSYPSNTTTWQANSVTTSADPTYTLTAYAICINP